MLELDGITDEPELPRQRQVSRRIDQGAPGHVFFNSKGLFQAAVL